MYVYAHQIWLKHKKNLGGTSIYYQKIQRQPLVISHLEKTTTTTTTTYPVRHEHSGILEEERREDRVDQLLVVHDLQRVTRVKVKAGHIAILFLRFYEGFYLTKVLISMYRRC